ncbi:MULTISPECIES: hypothetical protein [Mycolicibacterium]|uniref:Uncharacterized protein n=1 Tax=Mycolicibacterium alvei TaxID=67081 RepID=A0A6N4V176_9MYCO|nr:MULTISPECIES: hypothetical protein [Mycolicibacterium]MCV7003594.1 hypothetical protein [Mycolicibacterium alvei]BBX30449.1 hypothetical protein MALV_55740 [Mycolicibacterium alvei]
MTSTENRPYVFELAAQALISAEEAEISRSIVERKDISTESFDRAVATVQALKAAGEDLDEWVRRQYIVDGWLQGWLQVDAQLLTDAAAASTWQLAQLAAGFYGH